MNFVLARELTLHTVNFSPAGRAGMSYLNK
jgi:hypothetical protein